MIITRLIKLLFWFLVLLVIEEIGLAGTCGVFVVINLASLIFTAPHLSFMLILQTIVSGLLTGVVAYLGAELCLLIIRALHALGVVIVAIIFIALLAAIIF